MNSNIAKNDNSNIYSQSHSKLMNGGFDQNNYGKNSYELKGIGFNRWENLFFDPQKNSIEPFQRIGQNTVLFSLDKHLSECGNK